MSGFGAFLGKELRETVHTWRLWVLPGVHPVLGAVVAADHLPHADAGRPARRRQQGFGITVSDPTALAGLRGVPRQPQRARALRPRDRLRRHRELRRCAAAPRRWRWPSRCRAAPSCSPSGCRSSVVIAVAAVLGTASASPSRQAVRRRPGAEAVAAVALWLVYALMILSVMVLAQRRAAGAGGRGRRRHRRVRLAAVLAQFEVTSRVTPAGLMPAAASHRQRRARALAGAGRDGIAVSAACLAAAVWRFSRREI